jgi:hypothetical protein
MNILLGKEEVMKWLKCPLFIFDHSDGGENIVDSALVRIGVIIIEPQLFEDQEERGKPISSANI